MRTRLYLETSIWGFYHDESPRSELRREAVQTLFEQIRMGMFEACVGLPVLREISASEEPYRSRDLQLIGSLDPTILEPDPGELSHLVDLYREARVLGEKHSADLGHVALVTLSDVHVLVTYNCRHLANYRVMQKIKATNLGNGYRTDFQILTPEEVVSYEEHSDR